MQAVNWGMGRMSTIHLLHEEGDWEPGPGRSNDLKHFV